MDTRASPAWSVSAAAASPHEIALFVFAQARDCGFEAAALGCMPATELPAHDLYQAWLAADLAGEMSYLARDAEPRRDPRRLCERARSVLCIAVSYHHPEPPLDEAGPALRGQIARYARAEDYHLLLKRRLQDLAERLQARFGGELAYRVCVDTAPVMERALGEAAGLGFIGKNTLLITPGLGSFTLLCELLLELDLPPLRSLPGEPIQPPPDPPRSERSPLASPQPRPTGSKCGSCTLCLDVCPTGAFVAPYRLDARRCISYLTIENSGRIPVELRRAIGTWIFGCDLCQEVCPWNASPILGPRADRELRPRPQQSRPRLLWLLSLGQAQVRRFVKRTALRRLGRNQLLRNVAVALGNVGTPAELPALVAALAKEPPLVREHLAWALSEIARRHRATDPTVAPAARQALAQALATETEAEVRGALAQALSALDPDSGDAPAGPATGAGSGAASPGRLAVAPR